MLSQSEFLNTRIKPRQEKLNHALASQDEGNSIWTKTSSNKELSKGCQACKTGTWMCIYVGNRCNATCRYCPQGSKEDKEKRIDDVRSTGYTRLDDLKSLIVKQSNIVTGISYSGGEPLLYLPKIREIAMHVHNNNPNIYQWLYTNGLLLREDILRQLADLNIQEIRVHLGATEFSDEVLSSMKLATKYIKYVNVETPSVPSAKEYLIKKGKIHLLHDMGVNQINLAELIIRSEFNNRYIGNAELYNYCSPGFMVTSPTYSREITYDIMDYAIQYSIDIIINDCSNSAKYWQQYMSRKNSIQLQC